MRSGGHCGRVWVQLGGARMEPFDPLIHIWRTVHPPVNVGHLAKRQHGDYRFFICSFLSFSLFLFFFLFLFVFMVIFVSSGRFIRRFEWQRRRFEFVCDAGSGRFIFDAIPRFRQSRRFATSPLSIGIKLIANFQISKVGWFSPIFFFMADFPRMRLNRIKLPAALDSIHDSVWNSTQNDERNLLWWIDLIPHRYALN